MNGPTQQLQGKALATATGSADLGHLSVGNVPQRPSTATSPATRRRRRLGTILVPGRGDLYDEMRAKKRQQQRAGDENVSLAIGEPSSSGHPRKRKTQAAPAPSASFQSPRPRSDGGAAALLPLEAVTVAPRLSSPRRVHDLSLCRASVCLSSLPFTTAVNSFLLRSPG